MVFNLALQYVQNEQDAQEISQDVFIKVYDKLETFREDSTLTTWIYRITINTSLDFIKAKKRNKRGFLLSALRVDSSEHIPQISHFNHPGALLEDKESIENIFKAINQLPEDQKTVLILLRIDQRSQKETAEIMNKSIKAIESLFQRAKKKLIELLIENEGI